MLSLFLISINYYVGILLKRGLWLENQNLFFEKLASNFPLQLNIKHLFKTHS